MQAQGVAVGVLRGHRQQAVLQQQAGAVPDRRHGHHRRWTGTSPIVYPCQGLLADAGETAPPEPLAALIGAARARVLVLLAAPASTQLVAVTGYGLRSVGGHLRVL